LSVVSIPATRPKNEKEMEKCFWKLGEGDSMWRQGPGPSGSRSGGEREKSITNIRKGDTPRRSSSSRG